MKYLKKFNEEISFSNILGRSRMADSKTIGDIPETSLYFTIDRKPYEKSQFGQSKHKVYLTKNGVTYYIGDIRKFDNGNCVSYLKLDDMTKTKSFPANVSGLNSEEMEIVNNELDKEAFSPNLMDEPITYREKIDSLKFNESKSEIDWSSIESKWNDWYEESNGEADYDDEFRAMKSFVKGVEVEWLKVKNGYYNYIEETNNEDDYDDKFNEFKLLVKKNLK